MDDMRDETDPEIAHQRSRRGRGRGRNLLIAALAVVLAGGVAMGVFASGSRSGTVDSMAGYVTFECQGINFAVHDNNKGDRAEWRDRTYPTGYSLATPDQIKKVKNCYGSNGSSFKDFDNWYASKDDNAIRIIALGASRKGTFWAYGNYICEINREQIAADGQNDYSISCYSGEGEGDTIGYALAAK